MGINRGIFREYDIRGLVGKELDEKTIYALGKGIGTFLQKTSGKKIAVGHDNRSSSKRFSEKLIKGLLETGCDVTFIGLATTPMLYFAVCMEGLDGGIEVTASHNPPEFNGLKIAQKNAFPVFGAQLQEIRKIIEKEKFLQGAGTLEKKSIEKDYLEMLCEKIVLGKKKPKVVVDTGNGTAGIIAPKVLKAWGCKVIELHTELDESFPNHLPDPTEPENVKDLIEKVLEEKADIGLGFDGDCDRLGVVTSKQGLVFADKILAVFAKDFLSKNRGQEVLADVKCSRLVEDVVKENGGKMVLGKTGHSLIKSKMKEEGILLAGEMSGHFFFRDGFFGFDDGLYAAGRLLKIVSESEKTLDEMVLEMPQYVNTPEMRLDCAESEKEKVVSKVKEFFLEKYPSSIVIDGIRIDFGDGFGLVRKSNTQAKIILRFEAKTQKRLEIIKKEVFEKLKEVESLRREIERIGK